MNIMRAKTIFITLIAMLAIAALVFQSCKKEEEEDPPPVDVELSIPETTKVIKQNVWNSNFVELDTSNYSLTFKKELTNEISIGVGDIIISQDGYGYLRRVAEIKNEGDNIKVYTSFASLTEAIENGSFSFETVLSEQKVMKINYLKEGVILDRTDMKSTEETAMEYEIDTYLDNDNTVHVQGSFILLPSVNAELIIKWFKVKKLNVEFVVDEQISLKSTIELVDIEYEKKVKLAGVVFQSIIVMVGPVPVVIVPELEIFAGVELDVESTVTTSVDQSMNYIAGMLYENKVWTTYKEMNKQLNYLPPSLTATATAKAYIKPQMNLKFYGTVAPYLAGELYGRIEAELQANPWWSLYGGVNIVAGVEMEIFGEELFDYYTDPPIIEYEQLIINANTVGGNQAPGLLINPSPSNNAPDQALNTDILWECSDPDNDPLTYDIYFGESTSPELVATNTSIAMYDPGTLNNNTTYYWKIIAKDDHNHTTEGAIWQFTTTDGSNNQSPLLPSNPIPADQSNNISISTTLQWECTDPENDPLTFDVYFGTNNPPSLATVNQSEFSFVPGILSQNTQYYWKIVAKDDQANQTEGVIWTFTTISNGGGDLEWVNVNGGTFQMGSNDGPGNEQPIHSVTLSSFEITKYEVTNEQYCEFLNDIGCNSNGSHNGENYIDMDNSYCQINYSGGQFIPESGKTDFPVIEVSWYGSHAFAQWAGGRLPTEAEWEFAARGGNNSNGYTYSGSNTVGDVAWYSSNSGGHTHQVGTKATNELGIHDMSGNVWEWCNDWYDSNYYGSSPSNNPQGPSSGTYRVLRGGSGNHNAYNCRVANRNGGNPDYSDHLIGFRVAR